MTRRTKPIEVPKSRMSSTSSSVQLIVLPLGKFQENVLFKKEKEECPIA